MILEWILSLLLLLLLEETPRYTVIWKVTLFA